LGFTPTESEYIHLEFTVNIFIRLFFKNIRDNIV